jgi:acyl-CoA thioesterase
MGIKRVREDTGLSILSMTIKKEMLNGFGIAHGGITYSLADSALAFASNTHGKQAVSIETSISHLNRCELGDVLTARAEEVHRSNKLAVYHVSITNQKEEQIAHFKGTVYRTEKDWF